MPQSKCQSGISRVCQACFELDQIPDWHFAQSCCSCCRAAYKLERGRQFEQAAAAGCKHCCWLQALPSLHLLQAKRRNQVSLHFRLHWRINQ